MVNTPALSYDPAQTYAVEAFEITYRTSQSESWAVRIYQPQGPGPFPAILDVHGGAWSAGNLANVEVMDRALAASGIVVAAIDFRLAPEHPYPAQVADVNYGTRWLKSHASDFNADPSTVGAIGCSSGGHTVVLSAMRPFDPRYSALNLPGNSSLDATLLYVLAAWPVIDPAARYKFAQDTGRDRLVAASLGYFLNEDAMQEGNPHLILERREQVHLPPTLVVQGTDDDNLPVPTTKQFVTAYGQVGGQIEIEMFPGMPHGFGYTAGPETDRAVELMKAFIARQLSKVPK